ncbi:MAG: ComEC/Rec2 family competence protein [Actinomycetia bacterium]|nr:ComEC/Rec2 family competence protein [Actinomycetes bacterium]
MSAHGPVAGRVDDLLAGEQVRVTGTIRPVSGHDDWAKWRHEVGRVTINTVTDTAPGSPVAGAANAIRRTLTRGADALDRGDRAVFLGMVIGDDRAQTAATADDFRAAGLGHLLVVSGQNVAFVLAIAAPMVAGMRPATRLVVLSAVLVLFAVLTRFEPSVLRAVAMAGVGIGSQVFGNPLDGRKGLSAAIALLVLIDPFLVHVLAFQLSAAATAGIVWLSAPLAERIGGPGWFRIPFSTTVAAQLGVSPLLVVSFGPIPAATLPANLLAGPMSGPVMVWGCTAGLAAGVLGEWAAGVIHLPTAAMLWWIRVVAAGAARGPQATFGVEAIVALSLLVAMTLGRSKGLRVLAGMFAIALCAGAVATAPTPEPGFTDLGRGVEAWQVEELLVLVLRNPADPRSVLQTTRTAGVGRPDLVVATDGDAADAFAVMALNDRFGELLVIAPPLHRVPGAHTVASGDELLIAGEAVSIVEVDLGIEFDISHHRPRSIDTGPG